MRVSPLQAESFCNSIEIALTNPIDFKSSAARIRKMLNRLPADKIHVSNQRQRTTFYTVIDGRQSYLPKKDARIYSIARSRYLNILLKILMLTDSNKKFDMERRQKLIENLKHFILSCSKGGLDISRIVLTTNQRDWFAGRFRQKPINEEEALFTALGLPVRSKSERDIIDTYDSLAVPLHYEEQITIIVTQLVDKLEAELLERNLLGGELYYWDRNGRIYWNVPDELKWMNAPGSIWRTYYPPRGTIKIYSDIKGVFADGSTFVHEHEGIMDSFFYRTQASERSSIIEFTEAVDRRNFIRTFERDIDTLEKRRALIEQRILPRLWF